MESVFWDRYNNGMRYLCDKCGVVELTYDEWDKNRNMKGIYCEGCWNYIYLQKGIDANGNTYTRRSERKIDV